MPVEDALALARERNRKPPPAKKKTDTQNEAVPQIRRKAGKEKVQPPKAAVESPNQPPTESEGEEPAPLPPLEPAFVLTEADEDAFARFVETTSGLARAAQVFQAGWRKHQHRQ